MEHQLWNTIVTILAELCKKVKPTRFRFSSAEIIKVYYWAAVHDRPVSWACQRIHWPLHLRKRPLPSKTTMSRRLRSRPVVALLKQLEDRVIAPTQPHLNWIIDGKSMVIGGCSKDRQAGYGQAAQCKAKGYKLHMICGLDGSVAAWRIAPMNKDERVMAARMLKTVPVQGYVTGDGHYDSNKLHTICDQRGNLQLVSPRPLGRGKGLGHRQHAQGRLRSKELLEAPFNNFGQALMHRRDDIERTFAHLTNWGGGLACLPAWVRGHRRVHRFVQAKLILTALKRQAQLRTYVA
ncbi:MAG TPA: transposase [Gemmatales bacterium]|nr:transposase [Gemmatales bacterium]